MADTGLRSYFYSKQTRKFIVQFMRMFNNFQVMYLDTNGNPYLQQVPVIYGDQDRQAAAIVDNNSQSTIQTVPQIAIYITDYKYNQQRLQDSSFTDTMTIRQRNWNTISQQFTQNQGTDYNIDRRMPTPWDITFQVDVWTSNTDQKLQIFEQIVPLFNPSFDIQSSDNYVDWGSLTYVEIIDSIWTSATVPQGTNNPIDIMTFHFRCPVWISPPANVYKMGIIQKIIASVYQDDGSLDPAIIESAPQLSRQYITPLQYGLIYTNGVLIAMNQGDIDLENNTLNVDSKTGSTLYWHNVINLYGTLTPGISQIVLNQPDGLTEVVGTIAYNPLDDSQLIFTPINNTLPTNTFAPINDVIDPLTAGPGYGLPAAANGQRYLILNDMGNAPAWGDLIADMNDIIEYNGSSWYVAFDAQNDSGSTPTIEYVVNNSNNLQYVWDGTGWAKSVDGLYGPGNWSIYL
jgi:hypothetical protein